jgi:hypothetical protein
VSSEGDTPVRGSAADPAGSQLRGRLLPSVWVLPGDVWATRHDIVRGVLILYAVVTPAYGFIQGGIRWSPLVGGVALLVCALLGSLPQRRLASVATAGGLLLPSLLSGSGADQYGSELVWFLGLVLAWLYRDWLVFPLALALALLAIPFGGSGSEVLVRAVSALAIGIISVVSWSAFEARALRASIAAPSGAKALAEEFEAASRRLGLDDRRAKRAFALAVLRSIRKDD